MIIVFCLCSLISGISMYLISLIFNQISNKYPNKLKTILNINSYKLIDNYINNNIHIVNKYIKVIFKILLIIIGIVGLIPCIIIHETIRNSI